MKLQGLYNIPSGIPFAAALAQGLLDHQKDSGVPLTSYRVLLPTRRACRTLCDMFLRLTDGKPMLLPRLQPLGDIEEDELILELAGKENAKLITELKPAISPLRRRILLARAIAKLPESKGPEQDFALAGALGRLMDQIYTEGLDLKALPDLVSDRELAAHWEVTVEFLKILSERWPDILAEEGVIDAAERRNALMNALCDHWEASPPQTPVFAAGSTGSIPATGRLLKVIASLPQGCVILPGLDTKMDKDSWEALDDTHPQATLKQLLNRIGTDYQTVPDWPALPAPDGQADEPAASGERKRTARVRLASEMMRPAATADQWKNLTLSEERKHDLTGSLKQIMRFECDTPQDEAKLIAIMMRDTLETPGRTAALITPDRTLARRVATTCQRWGIQVDDSAGQPLADSPLGSYLRLIFQVLTTGQRPGALAALLKHKYTHLGRTRATLIPLTDALESDLLRGPLAGKGFAPLYKRAPEVEKRKKRQVDLTLLQELESLYVPLMALEKEQDTPFSTYLKAHLELAEAIARTPEQSGAEMLWQGEQGEAAALFFAELAEQADIMPALGAEDYAAIIEQLMRTINIRPLYGTHPRLLVLGQLEARMIQTDVMILAGLNEKGWPPDPGNDPWMSRPMRADFGLPSPDRAIGLAAHDFVQAFCAPHVVLTRARRIDGTPTVPARWLQRLDTVLQALQIDQNAFSFGAWQHWAQTLDKPEEQPTPYERPAPRPPPEKRPSELYVTAIERWMRDPYSIYARYILKLRKLDDLEESADAAQRGTLVHDVLDRFIQEHKDSLPDNAQDRLIALGHEMLGDQLQDPRLWGFWWPRFERLAEWFVNHERQWRLNAKPVQTETEGAATLQIDGLDFTLKARADRIDSLGDGAIAVIDYKTGGVPSKKDVAAGFAPQLPLEAVILLEGGFAGIDADSVPYMGFWKMTGGTIPGEEIDATADPEGARQGLIKLVRAFRDENTPYYSLPRPDKAPTYQDYAHLARVQEWAALDDSENDFGSAA
ncbi:MAG: double-strand break repair protein AddB [Chloroflexi bacterium]|nr:double-strand break repair protein AddB [Chloroflexota bacterium]